MHTHAWAEKNGFPIFEEDHKQTTYVKEALFA